MTFVRFLAGLFIALALTGCLVTRDQVREGVSPKKSVITPEQQARADAQIRYQELEERVRELTGRLEVTENSVNILNASKSGSELEYQNQRRELEERLKIYEEAISKLEAKVLALEHKVASSGKGESSSPSRKKTTWETAEDEFNKKDWKAAIVAYEEYRKRNPKGRHYSDATFKIGVSFHELGMRAEAKTFYTEVVERFPKSDAAKKARSRLKALN